MASSPTLLEGDDFTLFVELAAGSATAAEMAQRFKITKKQVECLRRTHEAKINSVRYLGVTPEKPEYRECLTCHKDFLSAHYGHRRCDSCKGRKSWTCGVEYPLMEQSPRGRPHAPAE